VKVSNTVGGWMNAIAGAFIYVMMALTVTDIVMRYFGKPILGSYEIVSLVGAVIIGLAIPKTSLDRGHICVDLLMDKISEAGKKVLFILTRIPSIALFVALTLFLFIKGRDLYLSGDATSVLLIPRCYLVFILSFCSLVETVALISDIFTGFGKGEGQGEAL
jgi:C4-dicarboxylate transporter DctQ subunit